MFSNGLDRQTNIVTSSSIFVKVCRHFFVVLFFIASPAYGQLKLNPVGSIATGAPRDITIQAGYAYVAAENVLSIYSLTNPAQPIWISSVPIPSGASLVRLSGNIAYVAGIGGVVIVDVHEPANAAVLSRLRNTTNLWKKQPSAMAVNGTVVYLSYPGTLQTVDCTDSANPTFNTIANPLGKGIEVEINDMQVYGNKDLYVAHSLGVSVLDVTIPNRPSLYRYNYYLTSYEGSTPAISIRVFSDKVLAVTNKGVASLNNATMEFSQIPHLGIRAAYQDLSHLRMTFGELDAAGRYAVISNAGQTGGACVIDISRSQVNVKQCFSRNEAITGVAISGDLAYLAKQDGLKVVDLSATGLFSQTGTGPAPEEPSGLKVVGDTIYLADGDGGLRVYDGALSGVATLRGTSTDFPLAKPNRLVASGDYVFAAALSDGFVVYNIHDAQHPVKVASLDTPGVAKAIALSGTVAIIADDGKGLRAISVESPSNPTSLGYYNTMGGALDVAIIGEYAYLAAGDDGLKVFRISNPSDISLVSSIRPGMSYDLVHWYSSSISVRGNYAFVSGVVFDVTNPAAPNLVCNFNAGSENSWGSTFFSEGGNFGFMANSNGLHMYDVSDILHPQLLGTYYSGRATTDVVVKGNYVFLAESGLGVQVIQFKDPSIPLHETTFTKPLGRLVTLAASESIAAVAEYGSGIALIDLSNAVHPNVIGRFSELDNIMDIKLAGSKLYLALGSAGVKILDIGNPAHPVQLGGYDTLGNSSHIELVNQFAFVADGSNGLLVLDVSNPHSPYVVGAWRTLGTVLSLRVAGSYAYVADGNGGMRILDITNPAQIHPVGELHSQNPVVDLDVFGSYAYVLESQAQLSVVSIANPAAPAKVGSFEHGGATFVKVLGNLLYLGLNNGALLGEYSNSLPQYSSGIGVLDINSPSNPRLAAVYPALGAVSGLDSSGTNLVMADEGSGVFILDGRFHTMRGRVTIGAAPLSGIEVDAGILGVGVTDLDGNYSVVYPAAMLGESFLLAPVKVGYHFNPESVSGVLSGDSVSNFNAAINIYSISGVIEGDMGPVAGVSVTIAGEGTVFTNESGEYRFENIVHGTNFTVVPSKSGYAFVPESFSDTATMSVIQPFMAKRAHLLAGRVVYNGTGLPGVTINGKALGARTTDSQGNFSFGQVISGSVYMLAPSKAGYSFTPKFISGTLNEPRAVEFVANLKDSDGDGISDLDEVSNGSSPTDLDSDDDGVTDGQEHLDGTNPLDGGSALPVLENRLCSEWNGFLNMYNILEHINLSNAELLITTKLYDIHGEEKDSVNFHLARGAQLDLAVHDMTGRSLASYGLVCSSFVGARGSLDGRMVYYRPSSSAAKNKRYDFAFAMPFLNPRVGPQYMPFNTYQPSLDYRDANNPVANWIQVSNLSDQKQSGTLYFHGFDGTELHAFPVKLAAHGRFDIPGHYFGQSVVGIVRWVPESNTAKFQVRNVRYFYDNAEGVESFSTAFELEGALATGERIVAPLDTRQASSIVELANTMPNAVTAEVTVYHAQGGQPLYSGSIKLGPYASYHLIMDQLLSGAEGIVVVDSKTANSIIATVMQYGRTPELGLQYMYGVQAKTTHGVVLKGSYNTYLQQGCDLLLVNPSEIEQKALIIMERYDGTLPIEPYTVNVPSHGMLNENICSKEVVNKYGVVSVEPEIPNSLYGLVVRKGYQDDYRFPTPVRQ